MTSTTAPSLLPWADLDEQRQRDRLDRLTALLAARPGVTPGLTATAADLTTLQELLEGSRVDDLEVRDALAAGFAAVLARELGLEWAVSDETGDREPVLRYRNTDVVFYPWRMLERQLATGPRVDFAMLLRNTRDYLVNLQRFLFTNRKKRKAEALAKVKPEP